MRNGPKPAPQVGAGVDDHCRVCKMERRHTVLAIDALRSQIRVVCDTCGSQHNYRGDRRGQDERVVSPPPAPQPIVSERERSVSMNNDGRSAGSREDLELLLRRVIREEAGITPVAPAKKWRDGHLVLRPAVEGIQEKSWPIETFFHKIVMVRNRLRLLEQQVNASDLSSEAKVKLQTYITGCYGSLTSFNVLFADENDKFRGTGGD